MVWYSYHILAMRELPRQGTRVAVSGATLAARDRISATLPIPANYRDRAHECASVAKNPQP
jgi:hypothetical protein